VSDVRQDSIGAQTDDGMVFGGAPAAGAGPVGDGDDGRESLDRPADSSAGVVDDTAGDSQAGSSSVVADDAGGDSQAGSSSVVADDAGGDSQAGFRSVVADGAGDSQGDAGSGVADDAASDSRLLAADGDSSNDDDLDEDDADSDNPLDTEAEIAADYLEELLDIADLDGDIDTYIEGDRAHVSIVSDSKILVGSNGEVLDALQELARLAVMSETGGRSRLMLDVAGYRDQRRKELVKIANEAAEEARASNSPVPLAPMNPFERKIVHDAVVAAGLTSASEGEEPQRHVVIHPA
jgi:spoIIIJ-associated protein